MAANITVDVVSSTAELDSLECEWDALLRETPSDTIFLTWEWMSTWWRAYGRNMSLHVLVARSPDGALVGLAPLKRVPQRLLGWRLWDIATFLGSGEDVTSEYLDFIIKPGWAPDVLPLFVHALCSDPSIKLIDLRPFSEQSPHLDAVMRLLESESGSTQRSAHSSCPVLDLPGSIEAYMAGRSRNYRKKFGEYERRCEGTLKAQFRRSRSEAELQRDFSSLEQLHHRRWRGESRAFRSSGYRAFHSEFAALALRRGWLRLFLIETAEAPLAALYCLAYGGCYSFYQSGRDPARERDRLGLVILHKAILEAIQEGASTFDFLRGREEYKYRWAERDVHCDRVVHWSGPLVRALDLFNRAGRRVRHLATRAMRGGR